VSGHHVNIFYSDRDGADSMWLMIFSTLTKSEVMADKMR
jgi:hypothetical protein